ncbi:MAG TPA: galactokinase, partial [Candidatus Stercoripulliclostridium merdigallinarum]|nr:galactokinase [Candidatus Stercoripulliclostridium merdigallinarum]
MAILYDKKSLLENKKFVETVSSIYTVAPEEAADRVEALVNEHKRSFGADAADTVLFSAPGRIEIVGNHTDHNNGKVIAAAISVDLLGAVSETKDNKIVVNSIGYPSVSVDITDLEPKEDEKGDSAALVRGIVKAFVDRGLNVGGFIATTTSDVFKGAGMSSSASFELFVAEVLNSFYNG